MRKTHGMGQRRGHYFCGFVFIFAERVISNNTEIYKRRSGLFVAIDPLLLGHFARYHHMIAF